MKYIILLLSLLSYSAYSFVLDDSSINDDDRDMIPHANVNNFSLDGDEEFIKVHHDKKKGIQDENDNDSIKLEGVNRIDIDLIDHATNIFKKQ